MRNKYPGICYRCFKTVAKGEGHFERIARGWRVQHADCAIENRGKPDSVRKKQTERERRHRIAKWIVQAEGTGKAARRARRKLRDRGLL